MIRTRSAPGLPGMTRLALALALLALLVPVGGLAHGGRTGPSRETSIFYYPWYGSPRFDGGYLHWDQNGHVPPLDLATSYYPAFAASTFGMCPVSTVSGSRCMSSTTARFLPA